MTHLLHLARLRLTNLPVVLVRLPVALLRLSLALMVVVLGLRMPLRCLMAGLGVGVSASGHLHLRMAVIWPVICLGTGAHSRLGMAITVRLLSVAAGMPLGMTAAARLLRMAATVLLAVATTISTRLGSDGGADCKSGDSGREHEFRHHELLRFNASTKLGDCAFLR